MVREDYAPAVLDEYLSDFRGFHDGATEPRHRARPWRKVRVSAIGPAQLDGLATWEMAFMANVAREIEEPIFEYSHQNGEGFRVLLPTLGRFLGKNQQEAAYAARHGLPWCESPWCVEERRHAPLFGKIVEQLTQTTPGRDNPNRPMLVTSSEGDAVRLAISRQAAEWNSSSTYLVMAVHATGELHLTLRNLARDEIKHLAVLGAADRYLFGPRPWKRLGELVGQSLDQYRGHRQRRSGGKLMGVNPVTATELVITHLLVELAMRRWLTRLTLDTLHAVFEAPSRLPDLASEALSPERRAADAAMVEEGRQKRLRLARWAPRARRHALDERARARQD